MYAANHPRHLPNRSRARIAGLVAVGTLAVAACGGGSDTGGLEAPTSEVTAPDIDTEVLDTILDGFDDELIDDDDDEEAAAWAGIQLVSSWGNARLEVLDADQFSGAAEVFSTPIPNGLSNPGNIDNSVILEDAMWVSATDALSRVSLADGAITATISIDDVLPGGQFGGMTGDADGVWVIATIVGGADVVAEVDPGTGTVRSTFDMTANVTSLSTITGNATHVAVAYKDAPGIPVKLIERSTGTVTDVGNYLKLHEPHIVRDELWVIIGSGTTSTPDTYEKFSLDGSPIGTGTLPEVGQVKVFGDRIVLVENDNAADPSNPVAPIEVEPQGEPIESFLPDGMVLLTAYAEIDGYAVSSGSCCLKDAADFPLRTAVIDMSTGEIVHTADSGTAEHIRPA